MESTNGRSDAVDLLSAFFSNLWQDGSSDTILQVAYMTCNRIAPQYENIEMGVGPTVIKKAIIEAFGTCTDVEEVDHAQNLRRLRASWRRTPSPTTHNRKQCKHKTQAVGLMPNH